MPLLPTGTGAHARAAPEAVALRLAAARTRLILEQPFLGALTLRLPLEAAAPDWCPTTATDARKLYFNPAYVATLDAAQVRFVLAHEALHCALSHFARRGHRDKRRWDQACDYAINPLLLAEGFRPPDNALYAARFDGMTAEEIYPCLDPDDQARPQDRHLYDEPPGSGSGGEGQRPPPLGESERTRLDVQWRQRLAGAAQQARQAGRLSANLARLVEYLLQPQLPWRALLARYLTGVARDDYSYSRPSQRRGDPALFPSLRNGQAELCVALDVSGSIGEDEMRAFVTEVDALKGQVRARVTLLACDADLAPDCPWVYEPWEAFELPRAFTGGGGTRFTPVFDWLARAAARPDLLIYFTDALGEFPPAAPACPVLWLVKGREPVPWGGRIQLN